jgi:hypothetical protein
MAIKLKLVVVPETARGQKVPKNKKRGRKEKARAAYQLNTINDDEEMEVDAGVTDMEIDQNVNVALLVANAARINPARGGGRLLANAAKNIRAPVGDPVVLPRPLRGPGSRGPNRPRGAARKARTARID